MKERALKISLELQLEVRPVNFCRFNDFPGDLKEAEAVKGFSNKADQDCQTDVIGEHMKVLVFWCLFWKKVLDAFRENTSTIVFASVVFSYAAFLMVHSSQELAVYEKSVFVYGLQQRSDFKTFQCCRDDEGFLENNYLFGECEVKFKGANQRVENREENLAKEKLAIVEILSFKGSRFPDDFKGNIHSDIADENGIICEKYIKNEDSFQV